VPVGPDDKKGNLGDPQLSGCGGRDPRVWTLSTCACSDYSNLFDYNGCVTLSADKLVNPREYFRLNRRSTDKQCSVAGAVGQFMQHAIRAVGKMDLDCVRETLARG
jgi:hypothetical protein